ncbi:hypothetical protein EOI86_12655 [Hwanghaeella grinnelliae]|uniref:Uncharacterized protein n=1 Tax=Hwanghaeella grinnelliae TaxID=2500179 RepID=A0A437QNQ0_9PROT|nr:hypothetical protein [Hwanghaeella grinnelliae]RVU36077.1 hypothetical protein EOI86_12655 [Hwanghaeella grinnelliae]
MRPKTTDGGRIPGDACSSIKAHRRSALDPTALPTAVRLSQECRYHDDPVDAGEAKSDNRSA